MKSTIVFIAMMCLFMVSSHAQLKKCTGPDGKVTYSDVACANTTKSSETMPIPATGGPDVQADMPSGAPRNAYDRQLRGKIAEYLARKDYVGASGLAVTEEHLAMIAEVKQADLKAANEIKAAKRAARPTVCTTSGYGQGSAHSNSFGTSYGGTYSGTTVCNK